MYTTGNRRVVIVGAGFGGLWATQSLVRFPVEILLIDRNNYHTFLPLLYQVAAAELIPEEIACPVRSILRRQSNARFAMAVVQKIDLVAKTVESNEFKISYDFLILATGSTAHFYEVNGAAEHTFPLKTMEQGINLRNRILSCFERAMYEHNAKRRQRLLTFTIVGGGATGVEFAGAMAELIRSSFGNDYPELDFREVRIILIESMENILPGLPAPLQNYAVSRLRKMGIEVRLKATVSHVTWNAVHLRDGGIIPSETVVWTAGVRGDAMAHTWRLPISHNGRVEVLPTLQVAGFPEVYVVGDLAYVKGTGHSLPMIAPVAI